MKRRSEEFFALSRRALADLEQSIGGADACLVVQLAAHADVTTGRLTGNLADLSCHLGRSVKSLRTSLNRLDDMGVIEWHRGRGPGDASGRGWIVIRVPLDARPPSEPRREGRGSDTEPRPQGRGLDDEPRPNRARTAPEPRPNRHGSPGTTRARQQTRDERRVSVPLPTHTRAATSAEEMTEPNAERVERVATRAAAMMAAARSDIAAPDAWLTKVTSSIIVKHGPRIAELIAMAPDAPDDVIADQAINGTTSVLGYYLPAVEVADAS